MTVNGKEISLGINWEAAQSSSWKEAPMDGLASNSESANAPVKRSELKKEKSGELFRTADPEALADMTPDGYRKRFEK